jgi:beta-aspartyl-peptidase (threonine type)
VRHPIVVAQQVMEKTEHCMLVGKGALEFAKSVGIEEIDPIELLTEREIEFLKKIRNNEKFTSKTVFENKMGTVGCVAMDGLYY